MNNVLFIDIDGVLHPESRREIEYGIEHRLEFFSLDLFRWVPRPVGTDRAE